MLFWQQFLTVIFLIRKHCPDRISNPGSLSTWLWPRETGPLSFYPNTQMMAKCPFCIQKPYGRDLILIPATPMAVSRHGSIPGSSFWRPVSAWEPRGAVLREHLETLLQLDLLPCLVPMTKNMPSLLPHISFQAPKTFFLPTLGYYTNKSSLDKPTGGEP